MTLTLMGYICSIGIRNVFRYNMFKLQYAALCRDYMLEQEKRAVLNQQLLEITTSEFWELEAKSKLGYVNEGERVYIFIPPKL